MPKQFKMVVLKFNIFYYKIFKINSTKKKFILKSDFKKGAHLIY